MIWGKIPTSDIKIDKRELCARLSVPLGAEPCEADIPLDELRAEASAAFCAVSVDVLCDGETVRLGDASVKSSALAAVLRGCDEAFLLSVTLGFGCERLLRKYSALSPSKHFLTDALADALLEGACDLIERRLCSELSHTSRFSPGYCDLPLSFVGEIVRMTDAARLIGVSISKTFIATPSKTVTAIIGLKKDRGKKDD